MVTVNELVGENHPYSKLMASLNFKEIQESVQIKKSFVGATEYGKDRLIMCLILQFMEDLSDREFERFMSENNSAKWFASFCLTEKRPDYSTICKFRNAIGCKQVANIFAKVKRQLQCKGYASEIFTFVDATALTSKFTMWEERDKSIQEVQ